MEEAAACFSLFFPDKAAHHWPDCDDHSSITSSRHSSPSSSSTGSVDCTLSLWTPSSRAAAAAADHHHHHQAGLPAELTTSTKHHHVVAPQVAWDDVAAADHHHSCHYSRHGHGHGKPAAAKVAAAHDAFVDRRCANCGTSSTPLWRNGPRGPKSLCNACGIRFKKEERRAAAMETAGCGYIAHQRAHYDHARSGEAPPLPCGDAAEPFLAWRLNVVAPATTPAFAAVWPERTSLFQYN